MSNFISLQKYDHETEENTDFAVSRVSKCQSCCHVWMKQSCHITEWLKRCSYSSVFCRKICKGWLQKFWIKYDIEDHTRYLRINVMYK